MDSLVIIPSITTVIRPEIIQDPLSFRLRHIVKIIFIPFWKPLDNCFTFAPQFHAKEIEI